MQASFSFQLAPDRDLIRITMVGFFEAADIARFMRERNEAMTGLACAPNQHLTLVDIRGMNIQSQEAVAMFAEVLRNPQSLSRRIAFVVGRSLARSQVIRAAGSRGRLFFDIAQAEAWLFQDADAAAA
ncbi:hypothetical protein [Sphingomonas beigongshangi]|uniref:hypothetical protein n=1 Tax=Sphingomonas beigongshangi TaxID=2782540 RepID=UPI00193B31E6|nr:hypothetical protein [Sphingomonas beigongshangi]